MITEPRAGDHPAAAEASWHSPGPRGRRPERRDHGPPGDHGRSRGRAPARTAGIKDQCMITEPRAGDRPGAGRPGQGRPCARPS